MFFEKIVLAIAVGTIPVAIATATSVLSAPPSQPKALTKQLLESFVKSHNYKSCLSLLSTENKTSLLFACFKEDLEKLSQESSNSEISYYFYNGYSWAEVIQLTKQVSSNKVLVNLKNGYKGGEIEDKDSELKDSVKLEHCELQPQLGNNSHKKLSCFSGEFREEQEDEHSLPESCIGAFLFLDELWTTDLSTIKDISGYNQLTLKEFRD